MIIPISFQFSEDFKAARGVISRLMPARWVSTYSRNPASLFDAAVGVRSTILITRKSTEQLNVTGLRRWQPDYRPFLFECTSYVRLQFKCLGEPWPRIASERLGALFERLNTGGMRLLHSKRSSEFIVGFKGISLYYISSYLNEPPSWTLGGDRIPQTAVKALTFDDEESRLLGFLITAGRIAGWWWSVLGDDFNVTSGLLYSLPFDPNKIKVNRKALLKLAIKLDREQSKNPLVTKYNGKWMGNYDMSRCRNVTDETDQLLLAEFGLSEYWPDLLFADQTLAKVTGERPGTLRKWPFSL
jgi:hypothetical protein